MAAANYLSRAEPGRWSLRSENKESIMFDIIELTDTELNVVCGGDKSMGQVAKKVILERPIRVALFRLPLSTALTPKLSWDCLENNVRSIPQ